ncbi:hypothetical protein C8N24_6293 [Solirubrobacter pauli]|uniref:Uncharacterized protein n=2 Tax=Solirubrobacter pauli TaxID=166793 RepID=A0A660L2M9_9ACTN|nr:hypothetical protein C8N24_6293 [Solirubrobacter pauli]
MIGKAGSEDLEFRDARAFILERDVKDDKWNAMTGTKPGDYRLRIGRVHVEAVETGEKDIWWNPVEPSSVFASDQISIASYAAALLDAAPLFDVRYNDLLSYRYELFKAAQEASPSPLRKAGGASYRGRLGAVRFSVINSVFSNSAGSPAALGC